MGPALHSPGGASPLAPYQPPPPPSLRSRCRQLVRVLDRAAIRVLGRKVVLDEPFLIDSETPEVADPNQILRGGPLIIPTRLLTLRPGALRQEQGKVCKVVGVSRVPRHRAAQQVTRLLPFLPNMQEERSKRAQRVGIVGVRLHSLSVEAFACLAVPRSVLHCSQAE